MTEKKMYKCDICEKVLTTKSIFKDHARLHNGETYECDQCNKKYYSKHALNNHYCKDSERFKCNLCDKTFSSKYVLKEHMNRNICTGETFECDICKKNYNKMGNLNKHKCGSIEQCDQCQKIFTTKKALKLHMNMHKVKPLKCDVCAMKFLYPNSLKRHKMVHKGRGIYFPSKDAELPCCTTEHLHIHD